MERKKHQKEYSAAYRFISKIEFGIWWCKYLSSVSPQDSLHKYKVFFAFTWQKNPMVHIKITPAMPGNSENKVAETADIKHPLLIKQHL